MNIAAYCRVSTDKDDQLNSLEAQKRFFEEYTKKNGHALVKLYADEGLSGTKIKNRTDFQKLMRDAKHGFFDMVVVKDISRFARNTVDLLNSTRQLKALNIETMFLTSNMTVLGNSEFVLTIFGALAQEESANTSKRVKFGKKLNAEKGRVPNIVYGYDKTIGDYFNLKINEFEANVVRRIYDMYINEGYGAAKISMILNAEGLKTKRNCNWSQTGICHILTNELYTGVIVNGKQEVEDFLTGVRKDKDETDWIVSDRPELRIIDPELQEKAKRILADRRDKFKFNKERQSNRYMFSTLIKCADCGYSFRRTQRTYKNTYVKWVCSSRNGKGAAVCDNRTVVSEPELIESLQVYFTELLEDRENIVKRVVKEFARLYKSQDENAQVELSIRTRLANCEKRREKYMDMYADDLISREKLREKVEPIKKEIDRLQNELKLAELNLSKGDQLEELLKRTFQSIEDVVSMEDVSNAQLKKVIQKIVVDHEGNIDIYLRVLGDLGLDETVLVRNNRTQGHDREALQHIAQQSAAGGGGAAEKQGREAHTRRRCDPKKVSKHSQTNGRSAEKRALTTEISSNIRALRCY